MFAAALACWRRLCSDYEHSETVRIRLLGYAFSGVAVTLFQEVMGEAKRGITAEEVWTLMAAKLYNDDMIETQRANFNATSLEAGEDVSGLAKRLYELALGLPQLQGSSRSILLMQRLKDALPSELRTHMATIRNTHSFDAAAVVFSQIQREKGIEDGRSRRREPVRAVTKGPIDSVAAAMPEIVQAIKTLVTTVLSNNIQAGPRFLLQLTSRRRWDLERTQLGRIRSGRTTGMWHVRVASVTVVTCAGILSTIRRAWFIASGQRRSLGHARREMRWGWE
jgi:hypothetical protein